MKFHDLMPEVYKNNWKKASADPDIFTNIYCSNSNRSDTLLPNQSFFIKQFYSGLFDELWMSGGNSAGKTFTGKFLGMWASTYKIKPGKKWKSLDEFQTTPYNILCTGPEQKHAIELWEKIEDGFKNSTFLKYKVKSITYGTRVEPYPRIELKNGSVFDAIGLHDKGKHVEGEAYDLILINEPGDVRYFREIMEKTLTPRTWRRGGVVAGFGTPKGKGEYWQIARRGVSDILHEKIFGEPNDKKEPRIFTMFADSRDNTFADQEKIQAALATKSEDFIKERVKGLFIDSGSLAFPDSHIEKNINDDLSLPIKASTGHTYVHGVDFGRKGDYTVCFTADVSTFPYTIVNFYRKGGGVASWAEIMNDLLHISKKYPGEMVVDSTASAGDMQLEWLDELGINYIPYQFGGSPAKKVNLINNLQDLLEKGSFAMPHIPDLRDELHTYPKDLNDKGMATDCVMSLALLGIGVKNYGPIGLPEPIKR